MRRRRPRRRPPGLSGAGRDDAGGWRQGGRPRARGDRAGRRLPLPLAGDLPASTSPILLVGAVDRRRGDLGKPASPAARHGALAAAGARQARAALLRAVRRSPERTWRGARSIRACRCGRASCAVRRACAPGPARDAFCAIASLLPGTLPAGSDPSGALLVHCLDVGQDVPAQMAAEEAVFVAALGGAAARWLSSCSPPPASCWPWSRSAWSASCAGRRSPTGSWRRSCSAPAGSRRCS